MILVSSVIFLTSFLSQFRPYCLNYSRGKKVSQWPIIQKVCSRVTLGGVFNNAWFVKKITKKIPDHHLYRFERIFVALKAY